MEPEDKGFFNAFIVKRILFALFACCIHIAMAQQPFVANDLIKR